MEGPTPSGFRSRLKALPKKNVIIIATITMLSTAGLTIGLAVGLCAGRCTARGADEARANALWQPAVGTQWQIVLQDSISVGAAATPDVPVFDIDLYTNTDDGANAERVIGRLHALGKRVICYFSAGTYEPYRPDSNRYREADLGAALPDWPDERWVDIRGDNVRSIILGRIELAASVGCDAIDPDNMDGYSNENGGGFSPPLTEQDSIDLTRWMASEAASRGLATGLKNALSIIPDVVDVVQFAVNEECSDWSECAEMQPFIAAGKPVFHIEYPDGAGTSSGLSAAVRRRHCEATGTTGFSTVLKTYDLDGWVQYCDGAIFTTPTA
ncbi:endo alpha-1,4 polygalactosaminidase precursor [Durotheca rogersii]|uniref:endo alpha-1,4 polygalactosaminidase precursor n=1 Tax=Durotheca rogersii TaxID=419775 RepID=UPI0022209AE1|nr:endo alpha-1,4 polygalactosaminidase precursor [Durotheca rogersii]KAI5862441.1 endo alpha-1,4 polygalactosaminidase precursor [Durotheca rogersii]